MDLLGNYGSDTESLEDHPLTPSHEEKVQDTKISRRGKKLVSLHALLPSHILEQLYTQESQNYSDDEDGEISELKLQDKKKHHEAHNGLSSLLSELSSVPTSKVGGKNSGRAVAEVEKIGQAFLNVERAIIRGDEKEICLNLDDMNPKHRISKFDETGKTKTRKTVVLSDEIAPKPNMRLNYLPRKSVEVETITRDPQISTIQENRLTPPEKNSVLKLDPNKRGRKLSRREIEKALRAGRLNVVDDYDQTCNILATENNYVLEERTDQTLAVERIRVAPVAMYDTTARKDIIGATITGKARGKNQINFLMASAAALEENQLNKEKAKGYRASAKRKYGW